MNVVMSVGLLMVAAKYGWPVGGGGFVVWYFVHCYFNKNADCLWCKGRNKRRTKKGQGSSFHFCLWPRWLGGCDGSGRRHRLGTVLMGGRGVGRD